MLRRFCLYLLFLLPFIGLSCSTDFEVNEDWKEIDIVYGLLDVNDTTHYIKIGKAFLNEDESVYKIAAIQDSLYHRDSLDVTLQEWRNGAYQSEAKLQKTYLTNKDSGVFASPGQFLYKLPDGYTLKPENTYKIIVKNTSTGVEANSQTQMVGNISNPSPNPNGTIQFARGIPRVLSFWSGAGAKFYEQTVLIHYEEFDRKDSSKLRDGVVRWPIYTNYLNNNMQEGVEIKYTVRGDDFFKMMAENIPVNPDVYRKLGLLDFQITGGGEEIFNYMNVYRPSIGVVQKKPEYTNITNGQGIFSSRNRTVISVPVSSSTINELVTGAPTRQLNFRR